MTALLVAVGGALGALGRYGVGVVLGGRAFPWATLSVNVAGSVALGYVLGAAATRWDPVATTAVTVGFLGAFTTFSTFSAEAVALLRDGRGSAALTYVAASVALGLAGAAAGYVAARGGT